jgi:NTE family protein
VEGFNTLDRYINGDVFISTDTLDQLKLQGYKLGLSVSMNNLNRRQYPSSGKNIGLSADYFNVSEDFTPGNTSIEENHIRRSHSWYRIKASAEHYFGSGWYRPGYMAEFVMSNQSFFQNYFGTIINAPAFFPLQDSRTLILQNFRAFKYVAGGVKNVFRIRNKLEFRVEGYAFVPIDQIIQTADQDAAIAEGSKELFFAGTAGLVFHSLIGPISLSVNYYDDDENEVGVLLHVGFLLFNKHSLE